MQTPEMTVHSSKHTGVQPSFYQKAVSTLEHALSLLVVFLLLAGTALWTGNFFGNKIGGKSAGQQAVQTAALVPPNDAQRRALGLDEASLRFSVRDSASWTVTAADGTAQGIVISTAPYANDVQGFAGPTPLYIYVDAAGKVAQIAAADNAESPDFFGRAFAGLTPQWRGLTMEAGAALQPDAVSGATFSSKAIVRNIQASLAAQTASAAGTVNAPVIGWLRTGAVAVVLLLGVVASVRFRGNKNVRLFQLLLNVGVLGFWCGQFLSLSLLRGWIANGFDALAYLPTLLVLLVAVLMPFFRRKRHYCSWVCPYGSLQELAGRLPLPKIHCSPKVYRIMGRVRLGVLGLLLLLLWSGVGSVVLDYEPFTAFLVTAALPSVLVLAAAFVVASCFIPNLWCRCLCPMGMLLDLSENESKPSARR